MLEIMLFKLHVTSLAIKEQIRKTRTLRLVHFYPRL